MNENYKLKISIESIIVVTSTMFFVSMAILIILASLVAVYDFANKVGLLK